MRRRPWILMTIAVVCGGAAIYLSQGTIKPTIDAIPAIATTTPVVVAARDIETGEIIDSLDVTVYAWPADALPENHVGSPDDVIGRGLMMHVSAGEPVLTHKLTTPEHGGHLIKIPKGMRGVSVTVDEVVGVAGFVLPGTRVDVIVSINPTAEREQAASRVILQDVETLAAGHATEWDVEGTPQNVAVVTLLVSPEEAEILTLAATEGRIQLALRNNLDAVQVATTGANAKNLVRVPGRAPKPALTPYRPPMTTVETYNGPNRTVESFDHE